MSLGDVVLEAVQIARQMRADGATDDERLNVIEATLREVWPKGRAWKYVCEACRDTGLVIREGVKNRLGCLVDEGSPCGCGRGSRFTPKAPSGDDYMQAGKAPKRTNFSRWGG